MDLTDEQWAVLEPLIPKRRLRADRRGQPCRWKVERRNAWLQNYRRVLVRHDYHLENYLRFVHLACMLILLRHL